MRVNLVKKQDFLQNTGDHFYFWHSKMTKTFPFVFHRKNSKFT